MNSLVESLKKRADERRCVPIRASEFANGIEGELGIRVLTVAELSDATAAAAKFRESTLSGLGDRARELIDTPDVFRDAELTEVLWRSCRDSSDASKPAFPSAQWMRDHLTSSEISSLTNILDAVTREYSPGGNFTHDEAERYLGIIAACESDEDAARAVAALERVAQHSLLAWAAKKLSVLQDEVWFLREQLGNKTTEGSQAKGSV